MKMIGLFGHLLLISNDSEKRNSQITLFRYFNNKMFSIISFKAIYDQLIRMQSVLILVLTGE